MEDLLMSVHILKGTKLSKIKIDDWIMLSANYYKVWKQCFTFESICWINNKLWLYQTSLVAQTVKCLPAVQETRVWSLGWEDPLEKEMETFSSILAWRIPWTEEPGGLQSTGSQRVGRDSDFTFTFHFHFQQLPEVPSPPSAPAPSLPVSSFPHSSAASSITYQVSHLPSRDDDTI